MTNLISFLRDEQGQDLVEYTLLLAFVALAAAGVYSGMKTSISTIWTQASSTLAAPGGGS